MHSSRPDWVFGRGAVDLVDQHHVREHRPGPELELALALVEDVGADHVGGQQVGGALDARVLGVDRPRQRPRQGGLADARVVLDQHVALGEQGHQHLPDGRLGRLHRLRDVVAQATRELCDCRGVEVRRGRHRHDGRGPRARWLPLCHQLAHGRLGIRRAHHRLPHQHRVHAHPLELLDLLAVDDAGLRHHRLARRHVGQQVERAGDVHGEVVEVAVVDADHVGVHVQRRLQLVRARDLDDRVQVQLARRGVQLGQLAVAQRARPPAAPRPPRRRWPRGACRGRR